MKIKIAGLLPTRQVERRQTQIQGGVTLTAMGLAAGVVNWHTNFIIGHGHRLILLPMPKRGRMNLPAKQLAGMKVPPKLGRTNLILLQNQAR